MKQTVVKCEHCQKYIRAAIQMDEVMAKTAVITGNKQQCPHCNKMTSADKLEWIEAGDN